MPLVIPIQPVPSQQVLCVLGGQNCQIGIYIRSAEGFTNVYFDLNSNGVDMCVATLAHNGVPLDACNSYDGFQGNLFFIDTQGDDDPQYTGFNSRWFLIYLTPAELLDTLPIASNVLELAPTMTLSAVLSVVAPAPGAFSEPHGLGVVPFLIEIIPTATEGIIGAVWAQAGFADDTDVNLVGSETNVSATVLVYTATASGLTTQAPARTVLVDSPGAGNFSVAHGLGAVPSAIEILPTSDGPIWGQNTLYDGTNINLAAFDAGETVTISVYAPAASLVLAAPATILGVTASAPGPFSVPHFLPAAPSRIQILMISDGVITAQTPAFDATNIYLNASDAGRVAKIAVYA